MEVRHINKGFQCSVKGCESPSHCHTYCQKHYMRYRRHGNPLITFTTRDLTEEERFWNFVDKTTPNGCWQWTGAITTFGYGQFPNSKTSRTAHRYSYVLANGNIPQGLWVLHRCDVPQCVRPEHLFLGTALDNNRDKIQKGRAVLNALKGNSHPNARLNHIVVRLIRLDSSSYSQVAAKWGITKGHVARIKNRQSWRHI